MKFLISEFRVINNKKRKIFVEYIPRLASAFTSDDTVYKEVEKIYHEHKKEIKELTMSSKYAKMPELFVGNIEIDKKTMKALGVVELIKKNNDAEMMISLIQKGWEDLYRIAQSEIENNSVELENSPTKTEQTGGRPKYAKITRYELAMYNIFTFIGYNFCKNTEYKFLVDKSIANLESEEDIDEEEENLIESRSESIKNRFLETINNAKDFDELYVKVDRNISRIFSFISKIHDTSKLEFHEVANDLNIDEKDVKDFARSYFIQYRNQDREKSFEHILFALYTSKMAEAYKSLKKEYFDLLNSPEIKAAQTNIKEEFDLLKEEYKTLENNEKFLSIQLSALKKENERLKKEYKQTIEKENIELLQEIQSLKKENSEHLVNQANLKKELEEFEEFANSLLSEEYNENIEKELKVILPIIQNLNILILGGHKGWHDRMKEVIGDNLVCISGDNVNFDKTLIDKRDFVFINTSYMSHGFYKKILPRIKSLDIPFSYVKSTSINYAIKEMYEFISKNN